MSDAVKLERQERLPSLPLRNDTFLGVCQALGEDFGFHPNWLRVALSAGLLWNPYAVIGTYLGIGVIVAFSRFFFPKLDPAAPAVGEAEVKEERELIAA